MPELLERDLLAERLEQLRRREQAADVVVRAQQRERLVDHVLLVASAMSRMSPALRSLITQRGSRSTMKQMPPRCWARCSTARRRRRGPLGPTVQPVGALGEELLGQRVAEGLVVDAEVVDVDARLRHAGRAAGLEDRDRPAPRSPSAPSAARGRRAATRPRRSRTCRGRRSPSRPGAGRSPPASPSPARTACRWGVEVPGHDLAHPGVEPVACGLAARRELLRGGSLHGRQSAEMR